jgi:hypothetical protein
VGSKALDGGMFGSCLYDVPDCLGCDSIAPDLVQPEVEIDVYVFLQLRFLRLNIAQQMAA